MVLTSYFVIVGAKRNKKQDFKRDVHSVTLSYDRPWFCFEDKCICSSSRSLLIFNCSNNKGKLTFVPLPKGTTGRGVDSLDFSFNNLTAIPSDFFKNVTGIFKIDLSNNNLNYIAPSSFRELTNLRALVLDNNTDLDNQNLAAIFPLRRLENLYLRNTGLKQITETFLTDVSAPKLKTLYINNNRLSHFNLSGLTAAKHLYSIHLDDCNLSDESFVSALMPRLKQLSFKNDAICLIPVP
jgi:Leucine-rich repeat (LRR) protein